MRAWSDSFADGGRLGHLDVVQLLIQHGADPEIRDDEGLTAIEMATHSKRVPEESLKAVIEFLTSCD
ncbi:MAG: ankyrin repeat domain-containing protein [Planctomycetota bacterium]